MVRRIRSNKSNPYLCKGRVEPLSVTKGMTVTNLIKEYGKAEAFNSGRLYDACYVYERMLKDGATVTMTLAGAMIPAGQGGTIIELMKRGYVDVLYGTGANFYHDIHFSLGLSVYKGDFRVDDSDLLKHGVERIYDIFIAEKGTLIPTDKYLQKLFFGIKDRKIMSTADLHHMIGKDLLKNSKHPEKSVLAQAAKYGIPIYCPSPGDSSIGMNLAATQLKGCEIIIDPSLDVLETTAIVYSSKKNGAVEIGGGAPKNFFMQTQPMLWQVLNINKGGHDYFIQITTDSPQWGGLSGATPSEAVSWGKVKSDEKNNVVVYCDATIALPILAAYVVDNIPRRKLKRLLYKKDKLVNELKTQVNF